MLAAAKLIDISSVSKESCSCYIFFRRYIYTGIFNCQVNSSLYLALEAHQKPVVCAGWAVMYGFHILRSPHAVTSGRSPLRAAGTVPGPEQCPSAFVIDACVISHFPMVSQLSEGRIPRGLCEVGG